MQARIDDEELTLRAQVFETEKAEPRSGVVTGAAAEPEALAAQLMAKLYGG